MQTQILQAIHRSFKKRYSILALISTGLILALSISVSQAYGPPNWQATVSGNCNNKVVCGFTDPVTGQFYSITGGFWGWCAFGGGVQSGNNADCQSQSYSFVRGGVNLPCPIVCGDPQHNSISGSAWIIGPSPFNGLQDFLITQGTIVISGPFVEEILGTGLPVPLGCVASSQTITCDIATSFGVFDTGIVAIAGHFGSQGCTSPPNVLPGCHYNQQVTEIH
jgi:hypothetical protein